MPRLSVIDAPFIANASGAEPLVDAGPTLTADELATLATRALKRPETISADEIRILAASVLVEATGQAA
jgi:hypothetical protein